MPVGADQFVQFIKGGSRIAPGDAGGDRAVNLVAHAGQVFQHLSVDAAATVTVGGRLAAIDGNQDIGQATKRPVGNVVEQGAIGLQLEAEQRKTAHHLQHHVQF